MSGAFQALYICTMKKTLEQIAKLLIYTTFIVPIVVVSSSFIFPFVVPKILLFRSLVIMMLGCYGLLLYINFDEYRPRLNLVSGAVLVFLASFALSTIFGVDSYHSFWDNHERMLGLFTIIHYVVYFLVCSSVFKKWTDWKWALRLFLLGGSIVMLIGVLQRVDPFLLLNQGNDRVASTLGNAIYVGGYGLFLFFVALLLILKENSILWRWLEIFMGVLALLGMFYSGTRGSFLGWAFGLFFAAVCYILLFKQRPKLRLGLGILIAVGCLGAVVIFLNRDQPWVRNMPSIGRLATISLSGDSQTRFIAWKIAWDSWKQRPIFGWGPNNFFYAFNQFYNPHSLAFGYGETWFDNAHNIILNTLSVQGAVGLVSYLSIFAVSLYVVFRNKNRDQGNYHLAIMCGAFLMAHLVQNITVFENPTSYLYFFFWLALVSRLFAYSETADEVVEKQNRSTVAAASPDHKIGWGAVGMVGAGVLLIIFIFNIQPARANVKTLAALESFERDPVGGIPAFREALQFNSPHIDDIRSDLSRTAIEALSSSLQKIAPSDANEILDMIHEALEANLIMHPMDIRVYMLLAQTDQLRYVVNHDPRILLEAEAALDKAITYSPHRQQFIYMSAIMKAQFGKRDEAIRLMEQTITDDPKIAEGYWRLAYIYYLFKDNAKGLEVINSAKAQGLVFDAQGSQVEAMLTAPQAAPGTKK